MIDWDLLLMTEKTSPVMDDFLLFISYTPTLYREFGHFLYTSYFYFMSLTEVIYFCGFLVIAPGK